MEKSNEKKITIYQIAEYAHVSPATVSRVINHRDLVKSKTLQAVENAMKELGVEIPESKKKESKMTPVIILNVPTITNIFYTEVIQGVLNSAKSHGCRVLINQSPLDYGTIDDFCSTIKQINASGVILLNQVSLDVIRKIEDLVPLVQCCEYNPDASLPYVSINDRNAAHMATEYLITRGHNKIAFINGPLSYKYARERHRGFLDAINENNLTIPSSWMVHLPEVDYDMAFSAISQILNSPVIPNAFFASSDILAAAAIRAAKRYHYRVPEDISVVGFDNISLSAMFSPSITTINQPKQQEGFTACEMLLDRIARPELAMNSILLETELIVRESTN